MPRPYPGGRRRRPGRPRRRPGRRSSHRYTEDCQAGRPEGFTSPGFRQLYDAILPTTGRRAYFNRLAGGVALSAGAGGAYFGYAVGGLPGAVLGFAAALVAMGRHLEEGRFYRR
jgi:hypothetical protein